MSATTSPIPHGTAMSHLPRVGVRSTRQRNAIVKVLSTFNNFASAKAIYEELKASNESVGLTTVYRTLQSLADMDAVDVLHMATGESLYRVCDTNRHHHHLVCTQCGHTIEIEGGPVEAWARQQCGKAGYVMTGHTAEVFGLCRNCRNAES